jgi:hypothetical protein
MVLERKRVARHTPPWDKNKAVIDFKGSGTDCACSPIDVGKGTRDAKRSICKIWHETNGYQGSVFLVSPLAIAVSAGAPQ